MTPVVESRRSRTADVGRTGGRGRSAARFESLEGYRGLAALLIVVFHVYQYMRFGNPVRYPYAGTPWNEVLQQLDGLVDLFFVLSAFLLTLPYARAAVAGGRPLAGNEFLRRRAIRILPLYFVAILLVWSARNAHLPGDWRDLLEHLTFTQVYDRKRIFYTIGPAWSLAVEVQFYVLLALVGSGVCWVCRRLESPGARRAVCGSAVALLAGTGLGWRLFATYALHRPASDWPIWFGLPAKLDVFAVGMLLALLVAVWPEGTAVSRPTAWFLRLFGLALLVWGALTRASDVRPEMYFHDWCALGFGLLLAGSVLGRQARRAASFARRNWAALGLVSYSLYMWHEPVILWLAGRGLLPTPGTAFAFPIGVLVTVPLALAAGAASYWLLEYPSSRLRRTRDASGRRRDYYDGT
jgi:peptidoglycan/LPS O-acetylase OafA/YrhL